MKSLLSLLVTLVILPTSAPAANLIISSMPTVGLSSFRTYTLAIETEGDEVFRGVDAEVRGWMNQVNPFGISTTFTDNNNLFPLVDESFDASQDSQFLFSSNDVLSIGVEESDGLLKGALSGLSSLSLPNPTPFVQITTDMPQEIAFDFAFDLGGSTAALFAGRADFIFPEPSGFAIAMFSLAGLGVYRRRLR